MTTDTEATAESRRHLRWTKFDSVFTVAILVGICVIAITVCVVWYPYSQTSHFCEGRCLVSGFAERNPVQCSTTSGYCMAGTQNSSLASTSLRPTGSMSFTSTTTSSSYNELSNLSTVLRSSDNSSVGTTTKTTTSAAKTTTWVPPYDGSGTCRWFPCVQIQVKFVVACTDDYIYKGVGVLYPNHTQLQTYPQCSYSSCGQSYKENTETIGDVLKEWHEKQDSFKCYANVDKMQVLIETSYSYTKAFNSIFWPCVFCGVCVTILVFHLCWTNVPWCIRRHRKPSTDGAPRVHRTNQPTEVAMYDTPHFAAEGTSTSDRNAGRSQSAWSWKNDTRPVQPIDYSVMWSTSAVNPGWYELTPPPAYAAEYDVLPADDILGEQLDDACPVAPPPYVAVIPVSGDQQLGGSAAGVDQIHRSDAAASDHRPSVFEA